jgi:hypothetical protein
MDEPPVTEASYLSNIFCLTFIIGEGKKSSTLFCCLMSGAEKILLKGGKYV